MKYFLLLIISSITLQIKTQDLHVYYNVFRDSLWYEKAGVSVANPVVKKGKQIFVHLVNFNNYIYSSNFEVKQFKQSPALVGGQIGSNTLDFSEMLSGYGQNSAGQTQLLNTSLFGALFKSLNAIKQDGNTRGAGINIVELNNKLQNLNSQAESINDIIKIINKRKKIKSILEVGNQDIQSIKQNVNIEPNSMKEFVISYYKDVLQLDQSGTHSNENLQKINEQLQESDQLQQSLNLQIQKYQENLRELVKNAKLIKKIEQSSPDLLHSINILEQKEGVLIAEASLIQIEQNKQVGRDYYQQLLNMYMNYLEIKNNTFSQVYQVKAESEYVLFNINIIRNDSLAIQANSMSGRIVKNKNTQFVIRTYGDLLISTSLGLAVSRFNKTPQRYFVSQGIISSQDLDSYYPMFNSLINVAYKFNSAVIPCFSLGAGVPISSQEQTSGLNYFVGLGVFIGKNTKIHISGGFMFTKINVLSNGLRVGDPINIGDGIIPSEQKYSNGYYMGLSFSLN